MLLGSYLACSLSALRCPWEPSLHCSSARPGAFGFLVLGILLAFVLASLENLKWCIRRANRSSEDAVSHARVS